MQTGVQNNDNDIAVLRTNAIECTSNVHLYT